MTEKRFTWEYSNYHHCGEIHDWSRSYNAILITDYLQKWELEEWCDELNKIVDENNQLRKENEQLKIASNENPLLWNEIHILMEKGVELSNAFKKYLDDISTDYDKFWRRKLKQAKKNKVIR